MEANHTGRIKLDPFTIRKNVDVKRLKLQIWDRLQPKLQKLSEKDQELKESKKNNNKSPYQEQQGEKVSDQGEPQIKLSSLMESIYYGANPINQKQVSVHSAFICLLHLANEKNLALTPSEQTDASCESDFKIRLADLKEKHNK